MKPLILYHANCADGFGAAYAAWRKFGDSAEYRAVQYNEPSPTLEELRDKEVYILDFSYAPAEIMAMVEVTRTITMLDHHKTAMEKWAIHLDERGHFIANYDNVRIIFDMGRSGARMAWDELCPTLSRPPLINHIGDRDLWLFDHPDTRAFCAGLSAQPQTFETWHVIAEQPAAYLDCIRQGEAILGFQQSQIDKAANGDLKTVTLLGIQGLATNATNNISEVGNAIAKRSGTYSLSFFIKDNDAICSLRSIAPFDCSPIAKHYGGGGHAQACGFKLSVERFFKEVWS